LNKLEILKLVQHKKMKEKIRIASGQGFWGDLLEAPVLYPELVSPKESFGQELLRKENIHLKLKIPK